MASDLSRRERRKREVHERIVEAAVGLFERKGIDATTVEEIAETADIAEKTFYNHFPSKGDLICELAQGELDRSYALLEEAQKLPASTRERLEHFYRRAADETERSRPVTRQLVLELIRISQLAGSGRKLHGAFEALLRDGVSRGDVPAGLDVGFIAEIGVGTLNSVYSHWASDPDYPLRRRLEQVANLLCSSLADTSQPE